MTSSCSRISLLTVLRFVPTKKGQGSDNPVRSLALHIKISHLKDES